MSATDPPTRGVFFVLFCFFHWLPGFAHGWERPKTIAIDAPRHSRVKGFNMIIRSDDLEQIQCLKKCLSESVKMSVHWSVSPKETMCWWCWKTGNDEKSPFNEILFVVAPLGRRSYLFVVFLQLHISILMGRRLTSRRFHLVECQAALNTHILSQGGKDLSILWIIRSNYLWLYLCVWLSFVRKHMMF